MPTQFRTVAVPIPAGGGAKEAFGEVVFDAPVQRAETAIKAFSFDYASSDHHINVVEAVTTVLSIDGATVRVHVVCMYADKNFDDSYTGLVDVLVLAQVAQLS